MAVHTQLRFDDIREGDELASLVKGPLQREQFVAYGAAAFDANPIHTDEEFARSAGYPGVFAQGMLSMGFLAQLLTERAGVGNVRRIKVRFAKITWPGEVITCRAVVTKKRVENGVPLIDCDIRTENEAGERKLEGSATVIVP